MLVDVSRPHRIEFGAVDARISGSDARNSSLQRDRGAGMLEKAGLIAHSRGDVEIIDRPKLEEAACECCGLKQRLVKAWQKDVEQ